MKLLLVDYGSIFRMAWHASENKEVSAAYETTVSKVRWLASSHDRTVICCDGPPYKRKELSPLYKADREAPTPVMIEQGRRTVERLEKDGHLVWRVKGAEADDVIASAVAWCRRNGIGEVTVASSDKDLMQLVDDDAKDNDTKVSQYSFAADKTLQEADVISKFGVHPRDLADFLALCGDKSDGVLGCPGCGPVTAAKWLAEHGTLEALLAAAEADKLGATKVAAALRANADQVRLARRLVTLDTSLKLPFEDVRKAAEVKPLVQTEEHGDAWEGDDDVTDQEADDMISKPKNEAPFEPKTESEPPPPPPQPAPEAKAAQLEPKQQPGLVLAPKEWSMQLEPRDTGSAWKLAHYLHNSRLYVKFPSPEAVLATLLRGRALGLDATLSLDAFHAMSEKGGIKLSMHADLIEALVLKSGKPEYFECVETTARKAVYETKRRGARKPLTIEFTIEDAFEAQLVEKSPHGRDGYRGISQSGKPSNWDKYRATMLRHRCKTQLARAVYPDVVLGLYTPEELGHDGVIDAEFEVA